MRTKLKFLPFAIIAIFAVMTTSCFDEEDTKYEKWLNIGVDPTEKNNYVDIYEKSYRHERTQEEIQTSITEVDLLAKVTHAVESIFVPDRTILLRLEAVPGDGYEFDHWEVKRVVEERTGIKEYSVTEADGKTEEVVEFKPDLKTIVRAYFVEIPPLFEGGPSEWTPEDPGPEPGTPLTASIKTRLEMIEGPSGCIDSVLYVDYQASDFTEGNYVDFVQLKKDGQIWSTWQGTPIKLFTDNTLMEVPCLGGPYLELYATNTSGKEIKEEKEVFIPHTVSGLTWDVEPIPGEECRMNLKLDFWGRDNHGPNRKLSSLVLTANTETWYNQQLSTDYHESSLIKEVICEQIYSINLTATDVDGNKYTWRETIEIPEPEPEDEPPPPQEPPQDAPPAGETLYIAFGLSGQCTLTEQGCKCTVSYSVDAEDRSAGDKYPVTNVKFEVNDGSGWKVWHNSGPISTSTYHYADQETDVDCDKTFNVRVTATNSIGQTVTSTGSFTTSSP